MKKQKKKDSKLSIIACILSLFGITALVAIILGIIDLCVGDKEERHLGSYWAIGISCLYFILYILVK